MKKQILSDNVPKNDLQETLDAIRHEDIFNFLKDNLRIAVNNSTDTSYEDYGGEGGKYISVHTNVELYLTNPVTKEEIKISSESGSDSFYVKD